MKINENLNISIKDYIGNMEGGVTSILSIIYYEKFYEGIYWYTEDMQFITFPEDLEKEIGCEVEKYEHFDDIKEGLRTEEADFNTIIKNLDSAI